MSDLLAVIDQAASNQLLLDASAKNIRALLTHSHDPLNEASVRELAEAGNWKELDNRFFQTLAFGTGGLRSKTIGAIVTSAEQASGGPNGRPEHPCAGTNAMNFFNVSRATQGLVAYVKDWHSRELRTGRPGICIAHDTRHFSRDFAEFAARIIADLGCDAHLFEGPRSTPELSFAVRQTGSMAGINLTASHNPPEYNGYKVYFEDGGQIVEPHASGIIARVTGIESDVYAHAAERGRIIALGAKVDAEYLDRLETLLLDPALIHSHPLRIVYSSLHGVGGVIIKPLLERLGFQFSLVAAQETPDGRFPTVKSPNPENAEALAMAMRQAEDEGADLVLATDPDDDRMGAATRGTDGKLHLLTGNQIGSLMAWYRAMMHFKLGLLGPSTAGRGVIIKTFVTTDLQKRIAEKFGLRCVETLTGFKYIGAKLHKYETQTPKPVFVFGGEESYGYSGSDFVRDKDGNSAVVMLAEVAAYARSLGITLIDLLDRIYCEFGYFLERGESIVMDGAEGAARIRKLVDSYASHPPAEISDRPVTHIRNFATEDIVDIEGDPIPKEAMLMLDIEGGFRVAIRPSGTEPKIKYYLFAQQPVNTPAELAAVKAEVAASLDSLWCAIKADAQTRLE